MKNITKRDIKVFILGMLTFLCLQIAFNWDETIGAFVSGVKDGYKQEQENSN